MKRWVAAADVLTALRVPLAAVFPVLARRYGGSRLGTVLDPVADMIFMATAFVTVARAGMLTVIAVVGVLLREIVAVVGFAGSALLRWPLALPARAGGKAVTVGQVFTLLAAVARSPAGRRLAWATAAVDVDAIWDYGRAARRVAP